MALRVGIVAGESSGDILGAALIESLRQYHPTIEIIGVAGPKMLAAGATSLFPMEKLSVMGFSEVLLRLRELLALRRQVREYFLKNPPDVYIGIDSPDFNLPIEIALKKANIKTVHCNSPTIWAWRKNRIINIARAVDLMLVLFPFEPPYYEAENIPVKYIGHPLADIIPLQNDRISAKIKLSLPLDKSVIGLLPGSRQGEIKHIGPVLLKSAKLYWQKNPETIFISPMSNQARLEQFSQQHQTIAPNLPLKLMIGQSHEAMMASDLIILASGTATLEALLINRPMVVVYRGSTLSYWIAKQLIKIKHVSLPNILSNETLVPELIQQKASAENINKEMSALLHDKLRIDYLSKRFTAIHSQLRCHSSDLAAEAIIKLLAKTPSL